MAYSKQLNLVDLRAVSISAPTNSHLYLFFKDRMTVHRDRFLVNETDRRTEFQFYWYYNSTCFGQPFCPSSGVLPILLVLQLCMFRAAFLPIIRSSSNFIGITTLHVSGSLSAHHQEFLAVHRLWYILCRFDDRVHQEQD